MKRNLVLITLLAATGVTLLALPTVERVSAACQNQICSWDGQCYGCSLGKGFACSPAATDCPRSCTETACGDGGPGGILPFISAEGAGHESCTQAILSAEPEVRGESARDTGTAAQEEGTESGPTQPARVGMLPQTGAPAQLKETRHGTKDLLFGGRLRNGDRAIVAYRLGWVVQFGAQRPQVVVGDWVQISSGLPPNADTEIPSQHVPFSLIRDGAVRVEFFVAAVVFADGSKWEADLEKVAQSPPAGEPGR